MAEMFSVEEAQLKRLFAMCSILNSDKGVSISQLMSKGRASRRTVYRDFLALESYGVKVNSGPKGYRVRQNSAACRRTIADSLRSSLERMIKRCTR
jgi:predicted DNA-binding transcriptional regulator YafY